MSGIPRFDDRSAVEWLAEAERYDRLSSTFADKAVAAKFRKLADDARRRAQSLG